MKTFTVIAIAAIAGAANAQILNGGFETGDLTDWIAYSSAPPPVVNNAAANSGSFSAFLGSAPGGETPGDSAIYQQFAVGAGGTLTFWTLRSTDDNLAFDWQDAYIRDTSGNILTTIFHTCQTDSGWGETTVNMSAYAGQTVQIAFLVHGDNAGDPTNMRIDDVTFTPSTPEPASMAVLGLGALTLIRRRKAKSA
jgi:hypothetical protein